VNEETEERASLYVLGLLEDKELADFEKELQSNAALRALIDELDPTAAELAHIVPRHSPPPELRERVLAQAPSRSVIKFPRAQGWIPWALAACLALVAAYLIAEQNHLRHRISRLEARDLFAEIQLANLESKIREAPTARAVVVWNEKRQSGLLRVSQLPPNADDHDYELWLIDRRYPQPVNGGVFHVRGDEPLQIGFRPAQPVRGTAVFAVSLERKGGVMKVEGPVVLAGK
jgi:anti-sigma-K factor RskA